MASVSPAASRGNAIAGEGTRERLLEVALQLFAEHSFAGTSLQMIADELGITKAAVYHHFHTREELLSALVKPGVDEMRAVVQAAEAHRTPHARAEQMLIGFVGLAVRHRKLTAILGTDQAIGRLLKAQAHFEELVERPLALLGGTHPAGRIHATVALIGVAGTVGNELLADLDDDTMRRHLIASGRRILGLRTPRAPRSGGSR